MTSGVRVSPRCQGGMEVRKWQQEIKAVAWKDACPRMPRPQLRREKSMKLHKRRSIPVLGGVALMLGARLMFAAETEQRGQLSEKDYKFVRDAAIGGMAEVELGDLARQKGTDQSVRSF